MTTTSDTARRLAISLGSSAAEAEIQAIMDLFTSGTLTLSGFLVESAASGIVAAAGGGQANATKLTSEVNRISTVATSGDSVVLPASLPGLTILVINQGANPMQVFGLGTDTIDGVSATVGVSQMVNSVVLFICAAPGLWQTEGLATGFAGSLQTQSSKDGIVALAGGAQAGTLLGAMINRVTTVASIGDSVQLPASSAGLSIVVVNAAANSLNVFGQTGDAIDAGAANAASAVAAGKTATFYCTAAGRWHKMLSA